MYSALLNCLVTLQSSSQLLKLVSPQDAIYEMTATLDLLYSHETYFSDIKRAPFLNIIHSNFINESYMVDTIIAMNMVKVGAVADTTPSSLFTWVIAGMEDVGAVSVVVLLI